jgi:hypothetical protein
VVGTAGRRSFSLARTRGSKIRGIQRGALVKDDQVGLVIARKRSQELHKTSKPSGFAWTWIGLMSCGICS